MCLLLVVRVLFYKFFFFNDTATTEIYTLSLHDALPISRSAGVVAGAGRYDARAQAVPEGGGGREQAGDTARSEEHTSELQSRQYLVCRLLLEKKKKKSKTTPHRSNISSR